MCALNLYFRYKKAIIMYFFLISSNSYQVEVVNNPKSVMLKFFFLERLYQNQETQQKVKNAKISNLRCGHET